MPVKLVTVKRVSTVSGLAKSIFGLRNEPELQRQAEAALLRANPHLAGDTRLASGSTVVVPEVPGLSTTDDARRLPIRPAPVDDLDRERLAKLAKATERLAVIAAQDGETQRAELKKRDFTAALARTHPDLREKLPGIAEAVSAHTELLVLRAKQFHNAVLRAQEDQERRRKRSGSG